MEIKSQLLNSLHYCDVLLYTPKPIPHPSKLSFKLMIASKHNFAYTRGTRGSHLTTCTHECTAKINLSN